MVRVRVNHIHPTILPHSSRIPPKFYTYKKKNETKNETKTVLQAIVDFITTPLLVTNKTTIRI